jgi:hypothetical protein
LIAYSSGTSDECAAGFDGFDELVDEASRRGPRAAFGG